MRCVWLQRTTIGAIGAIGAVSWRRVAGNPPVLALRAGGPSPRSQVTGSRRPDERQFPGFGCKLSRRQVPTSSHIPSQLLLQLLPPSTDPYLLPHSVASAGPLLPIPRNLGIPSTRSLGAQEPRSCITSCRWLRGRTAPSSHHLRLSNSVTIAIVIQAV